MSVIVSLRDVVEAMERPEDWQGYLNPETGQIVTMSDEEFGYAEDDDVDLDDLPDWQRDMVQQAQQVLQSGGWLPLPDKFDIHEWEIMRDFSDSLEATAGNRLLRAIRGTGAFRMFRMTIDELGLRDRWFAYRDAALRRIAKEWLEEHAIAYVE